MENAESALSPEEMLQEALRNGARVTEVGAKLFDTVETTGDTSLHTGATKRILTETGERILRGANIE